MDGYAGIVFEGEQRNVRASRALLPRFDELVVGPISIEILEPMKSQRLRLTSNPTGVEFDVVFTARTPPVLEDLHEQYRYGRVLNRVRRYTQTNQARGTLSVDGRVWTFEQTEACRDHSWGIRASMGPYIPVKGLADGTPDIDPRALRLWLPFEFDDHWGFVQLHQDRSGKMLDLEGEINWHDGRSVRVAQASHEFQYFPGSRRFRKGVLTLTDETGKSHRYELTATGHPTHPQGFGYRRGWLDQQPPGVYRGVEHVEHDRFRVDDPVNVLGPAHVAEERRLGGMEYICEMVGPNDQQTLVQMEHAIYGPFEPYGLT